MRNTNNTKRISRNDLLTELINLKQVIFEVTDDCNLSCKYCIYGGLYGGHDSRNSKYMSFKDAKAVIDFLVDIWNSHPTFAEQPETHIGFYGGEPLMNFPLIQQVVEYVEGLHLSRLFHFSMTSNCLLLDRYMDYIAEKEFNLLCSLDGDKVSNGHRIRKDGSSSFEKVFANIKLLKSKHPTYFAQKVSFNSVIHNLNDVQSTSDFIRSEFDKIPFFSELSPVGVLPEKIDDFHETFKDVSKSIHEANDYNALWKRIGLSNPEVQTVIRFIEAFEDNVYHSYYDLYNDIEAPLVTPSGTCIPFSKKMFVKVDGKIMQCEQVPHKYSLGNVFDGEVSINLDKIASDFNSRLDRIQPLCNVCFLRCMCPQCMYRMNNLEDEHPKCEYFMTKKQFMDFRKDFLFYLHKHPETYKLAMFDSMAI